MAFKDITISLKPLLVIYLIYQSNISFLTADEIRNQDNQVISFVGTRAGVDFSRPGVKFILGREKSHANRKFRKFIPNIFV